jgi:hypothetical protein
VAVVIPSKLLKAPAKQRAAAAVTNASSFLKGFSIYEKKEVSPDVLLICEEKASFVVLFILLTGV